MDATTRTGVPPYLTADQARLDDLSAVLGDRVDPAQVPHAARIEREVVIYDAATVTAELDDEAARREVMAEIAWVLAHGSGIVAFTGAFDHAVLDRASAAFQAMIDDQHAAGAAAGDHFAAPGANDRVWNALEKLAIRDPEVFVDYYANDVVALASEAWLGPAYQMTSQVNVVNPGGQGQEVHRDYHLGFQSDEVAARFPAHVHAMSGQLTLQGAVAHVDMPVQTGPTLYLPHSQKYRHGYVAWRRPEFKDYFAGHHVQLPLTKGDAVFFNPALFHAAGTNHTADVRRMANLLQVSSAFGRAMETIDRERVALAVYPALLAAQDAGMAPRHLRNAIACAAEGYAFPTNLDRDQPIDGLSPRTQAEIVTEALALGLAPGDLQGKLTEQTWTRASH